MDANPDRNSTITIQLRAIDELFSAPTPGSLHGFFEDRSGFERLLAELQTAAYSKPEHLRIILPRNDMTAGLQAAVETALRGYCDARIKALEAEAAGVKQLGRKELGFGLAFLAACLLIAGVVQAWGGYGFVRDYMVEGLVIIGWIALWHPVDMLIFARWPNLRDRRLLSHIKQMQVSLDPAG